MVLMKTQRVRQSRGDKLKARLLFVFASLSLFIPALAYAQGVARDALAAFPADTQQVACLNLAQLRSMADYPQIRHHLLNRQFRDFQDFLRSLGIDPEKDVDEVMLGWRGVGSGRGGMMGLANGRFDSERLRDLFVRQNLPIREYQGHELYAFGSGQDPGDILFVFLHSTAAAFGRLQDLKDLLDVRARAKPALDTNRAFVEWEAELEGTAPQWGISVGKAASLQAGPWLAAGGKQMPDPSKIFGPVDAVLYRINWSGGVTTNVSILCQNQGSAAALVQVLNLLRDVRPTAGSNPFPDGLATLLQSLYVEARGPRVELTTSAPMDVIDQVIRFAR